MNIFRFIRHWLFLSFHLCKDAWKAREWPAIYYAFIATPSQQELQAFVSMLLTTTQQEAVPSTATANEVNPDVN